MVRGNIIRGNNDHAAAAAGLDPVAGEPDRLSAAGARSVGRRVWAARADILGELRMAHREHPEKEPAVKFVDILLNFESQRPNAPLDLFGNTITRSGLGCQIEQTAQFPQPLPADAVFIKIGDNLFIRIIAGESRGEEDSGIVPDLIRKLPSVGKIRSLGRGFIAHDQRDSGVAQSVDPGADCKLGHPIQRGHAVFRKSEIPDEIEFLGAGGKFDHVRHAFDRFELCFTPVGFHKARDIFLNHLTAQVRRDLADEHVAAQDALHIGIVENAVHARKAQRSAGDADVHRSLRPFPSGVNLEPLVKKFGKEFS